MVWIFVPTRLVWSQVLIPGWYRRQNMNKDLGCTELYCFLVLISMNYCTRTVPSPYLFFHQSYRNATWAIQGCLSVRFSGTWRPMWGSLQKPIHGFEDRGGLPLSVFLNKYFPSEFFTSRNFSQELNESISNIHVAITLHGVHRSMGSCPSHNLPLTLLFDKRWFVRLFLC